MRNCPALITPSTKKANTRFGAKKAWNPYSRLLCRFKLAAHQLTRSLPVARLQESGHRLDTQLIRSLPAGLLQKSGQAQGRRLIQLRLVDRHQGFGLHPVCQPIQLRLAEDLAKDPVSQPRRSISRLSHLLIRV